MQSTILSRISAHRKSLGSVLHSGMARSHHGNPAASLRIQQLYGNTVLFSGLAPLVLLKKEVTVIDHHHKDTLQSIKRLLPCTPRAVTYFLSGSLPGTAILHLRQVSIFGMISRLKDNILNVFNYVTSSKKSWFYQIRELCLLYNLPHPIKLLAEPMSKYSFKSLVKKHGIDYW